MSDRNALGLLLATLAVACAGSGAPIDTGAPSGGGASPRPEPAQPEPAQPEPGQPEPGQPEPVSPAELLVTSGSIAPKGAARFEIRSPVLRAELGHLPRPAAEIEFVYLGPSERAEPLSSGELRRQIGLKLRSQNTCNVVYVMWHIEPSSGLRISVKSNPGQSQHAQCGDRGYEFIVPTASAPVSSVEVGEPHVLGAAIVGAELRVTADGVQSWTGQLPAAAFGFDGPVGLRSDNGDFEVELRTLKDGTP